MPAFGIVAGPDSTPAMKSAGFDYLEGNCQAYFKGDDADHDPAGYRDDSALPIPAAAMLLPGDLKIVGPDRDPRRASVYMRRLLERAGRMKVDLVVFGSGRSRGVPDGYDRDAARGEILDFLRDAAPHAHAAGVTIVVEPLNRGECNILNGVAETMTYVRDVDSPAVACLVDSYHSWKEDEPLADVEAAMPWVKHVHVADRDGRTAPGGGGATPEMYRDLFAVLKRGGYDGRISVEGKVDYDAEALRRALDFLRDQWSAA